MAGAVTKNGKRLRVFAHYVLGRLIFLFFVCHPGTLATCDGQAYLLNRYPNRDLVTTEGQLEDHRRHYTPRDPADFTMKTGVPEEVLNGNADNWTPNSAPSLEERFHSTVKAWLRRGMSSAKHAEASAAAAVDPPLPGLAFVPSLRARGVMDVQSARANDLQKLRWVSLAQAGSARSAASRLPAHARRGGCGHRHLRSSPGDTQMLLGFRSRGFHLRRGIFGASRGEGAASVEGANTADGASGARDMQLEMMDPLEVEAAVAAAVAAGTLEDPELVMAATRGDGLLSSLLGGAADAYDSALSFVGCALVTSPLGKRYLNAYDGHNTVSASTIRRSGGPAGMNGSNYDLVGFSNIDPFEASGRHGGGASSRLLRH